MQVFLYISGSVLPWGICSPLVEGACVLPACLTHAWVSLRSAELAMASSWKVPHPPCRLGLWGLTESVLKSMSLCATALS